MIVSDLLAELTPATIGLEIHAIKGETVKPVFVAEDIWKPRPPWRIPARSGYEAVRRAFLAEHPQSKFRSLLFLYAHIENTRLKNDKLYILIRGD